MFTLNHFIWLGIVTVLMVTSFVLLMRYRPSLRTVLTVACVICVLSELVKVFSSIEMIPSLDGSEYYPYMKPQHLPLHLCSLQILTVFYARFSGNEKRREYILAFMYPTCTVGALFALAIPSIFSGSVPVAEAFTKPLAYQYFIFHAMLIVLGLYIFASGEINLRPRHYASTLTILGILAFVSLYLNSMFADAVFEDNSLVSVEYTPNFLFTYNPPIDVQLTEIWHWYVYLGVIACLAVILVTLFYLPVFLRAGKSKTK